jgi:kumamolisin
MPAQTASSTSDSPVPLSGSTRPAPAQSRLIGKSDAAARLRVSVYVRRNPAYPLAASSIADRLGAQPPRARTYLTDEQFNEVFGADPAELKQVEAWAARARLTVASSSVPHRRVVVEGSVADVEKAFGVELNEYEHPRIGRYRGRAGAVHVPANLSGVIEGVFGLDNRRVGRSRRRPCPARAVDAASRAQVANKFPGAFFPTDVAKAYDYPAFDGSGQNVAVMAFNGAGSPDPRGGYKLASLQTYFTKVLGLPMPSFTDVVVHGPGNVPGPDTNASSNRGDSTGEVMLDLCAVGAIVPAAKIFVYFTEFTSQGWLDAINDIIAGPNNISVVSISYGNPEDDPQGAWTKMGVTQVNQVFQAAAAKGITVCVASGDDGSADEPQTTRAHVDFPASSPYVLGVGGTKLVVSGASVSETVWNEELIGEGAGGGGVSAIFAKPSYQAAVNVPPAANAPHTIGRGVPDVAAIADPETGVVVIHVDGKKLESIGGTSAAAPIWAALIVRVNQGLKARCGYLNPVLYQKAKSGVLRDITTGNNGAYKATKGWDACTGLGAPGGKKLLSALSAGAPKKK